MNRIKRMTVQELLDDGFEVSIVKYDFKDIVSAELEAKQYVSKESIETDYYDGTEWAKARDSRLTALFFVRQSLTE